MEDPYVHLFEEAINTGSFENQVRNCVIADALRSIMTLLDIDQRNSFGIARRFVRAFLPFGTGVGLVRETVDSDDEMPGLEGDQDEEKKPEIEREEREL